MGNHRKAILLSLIIGFLVAACGVGAPELTDDQLRKALAEDKSTLLSMANLMGKEGLTRVTRDSAYPDKLSTEAIDSIRNDMARIGIGVAVQRHARDGYYEYVFWSSGLAGRGRAKLLIFSSKPLNKIVYLDEELRKGAISCSMLEVGWYLCTRE